MGKYPALAMRAAHKFGLIEFIAPELLEGVDMKQGGVHKHSVFEHLLRSLEHAANKDYSLEVRLAALFHDIAKPHTRRKRGADDDKEFSFFGHEVVGARLTKKILEDIRFPREVINKATLLVRWHMFLMDTEQITLSAVRRLISNVGKENIWELMDLRTADRIGSGVPKEKPYRLRKYQAMIEEALRSPVSVGQLKIDGNKIMKVAKEKPGPRVGFILHALLDEVLDDPEKNKVKYLEERAIELSKLNDKKLKEAGETGKRKMGELDEKEIEKIRKSYGVR
jgi:putative nucleotidyltransferase with HDIG domain